MLQEDFDPRWLQDHRYGLIDAAWRDELPSHWPQQVVAPAALGANTFGLPVLIDLHALPAPGLDELLSRVHAQVELRETTMLSWLIGFDGTMSELAAHMALRMTVRIDGQPRPMKFRYFDPGTTVQLPRVIGEAGLRWLLGPIHSVWLPWAGQWMRLAREDQAPSAFAWTDEFTDRAMRLGMINRVAARMDRPAGVQDWIERTERIDRHVIGLRQQYGHLSADDLTELTWHATVVHPCIDRHPQVAQWLEQLRHVDTQDELDYRELAARIEASQWHQMAAELQFEERRARQAVQP